MKENNETFAEYFMRKRISRKILLSELCQKNGFSREEISRIERGLISPLRCTISLEALAKSLGIKKTSDDWLRFIHLAGKKLEVPLPSPLPVIFRTKEGLKVKQELLDDLARTLRSE